MKRRNKRGINAECYTTLCRICVVTHETLQCDTMKRHNVTLCHGKNGSVMRNFERQNIKLRKFFVADKSVFAAYKCSFAEYF